MWRTSWLVILLHATAVWAHDNPHTHKEYTTTAFVALLTSGTLCICVFAFLIMDKVKSDPVVSSQDGGEIELSATGKPATGKPANGKGNQDGGTGGNGSDLLWPSQSVAIRVSEPVSTSRKRLRPGDMQEQQVLLRVC